MSLALKNLSGKTLFVTGGSRGIGLAIAKRAAADGANVVLAAKTSDPNPKLPGTIHTVHSSTRHSRSPQVLIILPTVR